MNTNVRNIIVNYFRNQPVEKAWIFGSYSRGEEREDSDVDILVTFKKNERIGLKYAAMVCNLEDLLQKKVDMVVDGTLLPFSRKSAEHNKVLIYERQ